MATIKPTHEQITKWIWSGADDSLRGHPPSADEVETRAAKFFGWGSEGAKRFKGAKQALQRADAKNDVKSIAPFRRLRRNQSAVNESLIDAVRGLLALVRELGSELDAVNAKVNDLQMQLAEQRAGVVAAAAESKATTACE